MITPGTQAMPVGTPAAPAGAMPAGPRSVDAAQGVPTTRNTLRVVSPQGLAEAESAANTRESALSRTSALTEGVASYVRTRWQEFRNHRDSASGWNFRLLDALRAVNGQYNPTQLAEIRKFKGSEVYARLTAIKCRGATSLLRDVYMGAQRAWEVAPSPSPTLPEDIQGATVQLLATEMATAAIAGQQIDQSAAQKRLEELLEAAALASIKKSRKQARIATRKLEDILVEGNFYSAFAQFLVDLPVFPFAVLKGPVVRIVQALKWVEGKPQMVPTPRMFWNRVNPFDVWITPGVSDIRQADVIEKVKLSRQDLNALLGLPGYNEEAIRAVLDEYGRGGLVDWLESTDSERARLESRENPQTNTSRMIDCLEWHGSIQGRDILSSGMGEEFIDDPLKDYFVQAWIIGRYVIKCQLSPSLRHRVPYYMTSFEKLPGTIVGNGLPDVLSDLQDVSNAVLRSLVNNIAMASGPQTVVNWDRLHPTENGDEMFPWKRWAVVNDPLGSNTQPPVSFFQPDMKASELLGVFEKLTQMSDEISGIPRYLTGSSNNMGGAGRTASGLAMLMGNASKLLQTVCANVDIDVMEPVLEELYDLVMLTDQSGLLKGDESIHVMGVSVAVQRETERQRQLELLQITANPIDLDIIGPKGRASILRSVSDTVGLDGESIVPTEAEIDAKMKAQEQQAALQAAAGGVPPGGPPGKPPGGPGGGQGNPPPGHSSPQQGGGGAISPPARPKPAQGPQLNVVQ